MEAEAEGDHPSEGVEVFLLLEHPGNAYTYVKCIAAVLVWAAVNNLEE